MKCQCLFPEGKLKKYFKLSSAEVFTQHAVRYVTDAKAKKRPFYHLLTTRAHINIRASLYDHLFSIRRYSGVQCFCKRVTNVLAGAQADLALDCRHHTNF